MALRRELLDFSGSPAAAAPQDEDLTMCFLYFQGFHDFLQEMISLMATGGREVTTSCSSVHAIATSHSWAKLPKFSAASIDN